MAAGARVAMRGSRTAGVLAALLVAAAPLAAAEPRALLQRMEQALHQLDYSGTLVYSERGRLEAISVFHDGGEQRQRERLLALTGAPREVVRENGRVTCIGTAGAPRSWDAGALAALPSLEDADADQVLTHYELAVGGASRVAGRSATELDIRARDAFRYSYRLWLDDETGLLLKSVRHGADGGAIDQLMFAEIDIGTQPDEADLQPSEFAQPVPDGGKVSARTASEPRFSVRDLPPGFVLSTVSRGDDGEEHQVYSDGLASVSVYIAPHDGARQSASGTARGAMSAFSRDHDGYRVYVIGDVPERTAQRMAHGVVAREPAAG